MGRTRYRPTKKARKKERKEAERRHQTVEQWREVRGLAPDGSREQR